MLSAPVVCSPGMAAGASEIFELVAAEPPVALRNTMSPSAGLPPVLQGVPLVLMRLTCEVEFNFDFNAVSAVRKCKAESCEHCELRYTPQGLPL